MVLRDQTTLAEDAQDRPTVARWRPGLDRLSLRAKLTTAVAFSVAVVITIVVFAAIRLAARFLENDLRETARLTTVAVADEVELGFDADSSAIALVLHDFIAAAPQLRSISVFRSDANGAIGAIASTSSSVPVPGLLVQRAIHDAEPVWDNSDPQIARIAAPIYQGDAIVGAVVTSVAMTSVEELRRGGRLLGAAAIVVAIVGITLLIHLLASRLLYAPLRDITSAVKAVAHGDLAARVQIRRADELGALAANLNAMLAELEDLHHSLNDRVASATAALRQRTDALAQSYHSVLELRRTVARAAQLAAVGETMANVAHQIGTPLNLISGHVQLLKQDAENAAVQRRLRIVEEQVDRVAASVRKLLARAKPEADQRTADVSVVLQRLADAIGPQLETAGVHIEAKIEPGLPAVQADETELELAILNVLTNAGDAMPAGGRLSIAVASTPSGVRITIEDTGLGIPPDLLPRIFEPWVTTKGERGTGLGLSVTRDVVQRLGGTIEVTSHPGEGAVFTIVLPGASSAPLHGPASSDAETPSADILTSTHGTAGR
jgi:signal transduction histidine kinase